MDHQLRGLIISTAASFEDLMSQIICALLDIDYKASKIFQPGPSSLSFHTKMSILLELKAIKKDEKDLLSTFASIRNKFAHHPGCSSFEAYYKMVSNKSLFDQYLKGKPATEYNLINAFKTFTGDIGVILVNTLKILTPNAMLASAAARGKIIQNELIDTKNLQDFNVSELSTIKKFLDKIAQSAAHKIDKEMAEMKKDIFSYIRKTKALSSSDSDSTVQQ